MSMAAAMNTVIATANAIVFRPWRLFIIIIWLGLSIVLWRAAFLDLTWLEGLERPLGFTALLRLAFRLIVSTLISGSVIALIQS